MARRRHAVFHTRPDSERVATQSRQARVVVLALERGDRRLLHTHHVGDVSLREAGLLARLDESPTHLIIGLSQSRRVLDQLIDILPRVAFRRRLAIPATLHPQKSQSSSVVASAVPMTYEEPEPEKKSWFSSAFGERAERMAGLTSVASAGNSAS